MIIDKELKVGRFPLNQIYLGDSLDIVKDIPENSIDLILEDMPYNQTQCDWDVKIDLQLYWETRLRILKPTGVVILTGSQPFTTDLINSNREDFRYEGVWEKTVFSNPLMANKQLLKIHENILIFYKKMGTYNPQKNYGKPYKDKVRPGGLQLQGCGGRMKLEIDNDGGRYPTSVLFFPNPNNNNLHPTQKPVGLFEYLIRTYTNEGDLVFDGFGGSGTTAIAAHKSKRNFIVIEKEKKYFDLATKRLKNERAQFELF